MKLFLNIKSWQLFILIIVPLLAPSFFLGDNLLNTQTLGVILIVWTTILFSWFLSIGLASNQKLEASLKKSTSIFIGGLVFAALYLVATFFWFLPKFIIQNQMLPSWLILCHLIAMIGIFHGLWFASKQFVTLQKGREITFSEYASTFLMLWFAPIGVWFLQPKVNTYLSE